MPLSDPRTRCDVDAGEGRKNDALDSAEGRPGAVIPASGFLGEKSCSFAVLVLVSAADHVPASLSDGRRCGRDFPLGVGSAGGRLVRLSSDALGVDLKSRSSNTSASFPSATLVSSVAVSSSSILGRPFKYTASVAQK